MLCNTCEDRDAGSSPPSNAGGVDDPEAWSGFIKLGSLASSSSSGAIVDGVSVGRPTKLAQYLASSSDATDGEREGNDLGFSGFWQPDGGH
jgi:hypothetical protein